MAKLHRELAESLLTCTTAEKEEIGNKIVIALGGDITKYATGLPKRRGNSDGGIDGRVPIRIEVDNEHRRGNRTLYSDTIKIETNAAFCIKIESSSFDRYELNSFIGDMDRERIFDGIIISVRPLSSDAKVEFERHNREGALKIRHILVEDLLAGQIDLNFELVSGSSFRDSFFNALKTYLNDI